MSFRVRDELLADISKYSEMGRKQKKRADRISNVRLLIIVFGLGLTLWFWKIDQSLYSTWTLLLTFLTFGFFVKKHQTILWKLRRIECFLAINQKNLARVDGSWVQFKDDGKEFMNADHPFVNDLDIFGPKSLFQWLNITNTFYGRRILRKVLEEPETDIEKILVRQNMVQEFVNKKTFVEKLQCEGMLAKGSENDPEALLNYASSSKTLFQHKWIKTGLRFVAGITMLSIIASFFQVAIPLYVPILLILFQACITLLGFTRISSILNMLQQFKKQIKAYEKMISIIEETEFDDINLLTIKQTLILNKNSASAVMKQLDHITEAADMRYNFVSYILLNFLLLWDYHCVFALEKWKKEYGSQIEQWFYTIGDIEALSSLSVIARLNPQWNYPSFTEKEITFSGQTLGHPLIQEERRVCNDIEMNQEICIITGSNMSGKTTMLRTVGINLVLAYAGAPICGRALKCSIMDIFTSMRIQDDLGNGISTFYAELLRIKMIIDRLDERRKMIFLIDEIFRGTNSNDRITGAMQVLKNLNKSWVLGLISTHDFELCALADDPHLQITNYHFTESYVNDKILFDYKMRPGRCNTTNAKYLMKMVGIDLK
ncbi:MutS family DNA mismatch repair protein [Anaerosinus massiliensis]|uniref:MutS family DNA mismatch repair protein n=1 Tax=Massilibacillus massiliensis TaxID=1806837 RepID=UPI000AD388DB|nr:MutS family DNA mismatch repair protein [Massilibacillus massiliensis]